MQHLVPVPILELGVHVDERMDTTTLYGFGGRRGLGCGPCGRAPSSKVRLTVGQGQAAPTLAATAATRLAARRSTFALGAAAAVISQTVTVSVTQCSHSLSLSDDLSLNIYHQDTLH
jgi:hypothetical protein